VIGRLLVCVSRALRRGQGLRQFACKALILVKGCIDILIAGQPAIDNLLARLRRLRQHRAVLQAPRRGRQKDQLVGGSYRLAPRRLEP